MHTKNAAVRSADTRALSSLALLYTAASLIHFTHNAEFLEAYPNLPAWISRPGVYATWCCIAAVGLVGYVLLRRGREFPGLLIMGIYACFGFDGLLHYSRAPMMNHTWAMNLTIWFEVVAAALLLVSVVRRAVSLRS